MLLRSLSLSGRAATRCLASSSASATAAAAATTSPTFLVAPEVAAAVARGDPVVALESTIISHGMPFPANMECALAVEAIVRNGGAVPATIAILDGVVRVGLGERDIEQLARLGHAARKCSRRDIAPVVAAGGNGSTTVAGTMVLAHRAAIDVFVTGGCGGVHRGVEVRRGEVVCACVRMRACYE